MDIEIDLAFPACRLTEEGYLQVYSSEDGIENAIFKTYWWHPHSHTFAVCFHEIAACHTNTQGECEADIPLRGIAFPCFSTDVPEEAFLNTIFSDVHLMN